MMSFEERFAQDRARVEKALDGYTAYDDALMQRDVLEAMRYSLLGGGKRVRAVLAIGVCRALGGDPQIALPAACALEMVHAFSLIHDDLPCMDDDDMRRGKPACHKQFGEAVAVLAGDGLLNLAFEVLALPATVAAVRERRALEYIRILARSTGKYGMLGGQTIDVRYEDQKLTPKQHEDMVRMKTGALICAGVECGCVASDATESQRTLALGYARAIGKAFQITDDMLDVRGDSAVLGKPVGSDMKHKKNTFVTALGIEEAERTAGRLFEEAHGCLKRLCPNDTFLPALTNLLATRNA